MKKYTFNKRCEARSVNGFALLIPDQVFQNQHHYWECQRTFPVIGKYSGSKMRGKLRGDLYGLDSPGTGDVIVAIQ